MTKEEAIKRAKKSLDVWYEGLYTIEDRGEGMKEMAHEQILDVLDTLREKGYSNMLDKYLDLGSKVLTLRK